MVRACASEKLKFCSDKNFDILSLRLWCLNLSCLSRLEILDIWQPVPLQRKIEFVENLIRPRFLSICSQPSLQYPTETTIPNPNTPNMTQLRASYRGWQIRNTRFYLDSLDFYQSRSVGDARRMSNRNFLWQMWRWHLLHLETDSKEIKTRFNITSGKFFFLIKKWQNSLVKNIF